MLRLRVPRPVSRVGRREVNPSSCAPTLLLLVCFAMAPPLAGLSPMSFEPPPGPLIPRCRLDPTLVELTTIPSGLFHATEVFFFSTRWCLLTLITFFYIFTDLGFGPQGLGAVLELSLSIRQDIFLKSSLYLLQLCWTQLCHDNYIYVGVDC